MLRSGWGAGALVGVVALVASTQLGCSDANALRVDHWVVHVAGADSPAGVPTGAESSAVPGAAIELPARLDRTLVPPAVPRYVITTRVELPAAMRGAALDFIVPDLAGLPALSVDGEPAVAPVASSSAYRSPRGPHVWSIPVRATADGVLELRLEVENRWTQSSWLTSIPRLVPAGHEVQAARIVTIINVVLSACALVALFQIGLTSLGVYIVDRRRRPYLYFAIQALTATFYPFYVLGLAQAVVGSWDTSVLAMTLMVAAGVSIYFTHGFFDLPLPPRALALVTAACCLVSAIFHGPFIATRVVAPLAVVYLIGAISYQLYACVRLVVRHPDRLGALFILSAWVGLALTAAPDMLAWLGVADVLGGARTGSVGLALYPLWLSLLLSRRHIKSLNRADDLNVELAGRVDQLERRRGEIEQLNVELRHQVAERSSQIFAALALAGQGRDHAPELHEGELIQSRYRVIGSIGSGGMGAVYEVERIVDGRRLALKVARELNGVALARLAREAQIACRVTHPNVVAVVDVDVATSGFLYIVMELVEGQPLSSLRDRFGDARWALPILAQIAEGLAALHAADVVHRDLKPSNVLLTSAKDGPPLVKISDFGISLPSATTGRRPRVDLDAEDSTRPLNPRAVASAAAGVPHLSLTQTGQLPGTPAYIAPELVNGREHVAPAADLFAFGVIAFEMLARTRPFTEPPTVSLLDDRQPQTATSLATAWPDAPPELVALVDASLSLDARRRPTAAELARACAEPRWKRGQSTG